VIAAVQFVPNAVATEAELTDFMKSKISNFKVPKRIEFHDQLPREDTGKIFKRKLRDPYWQKSVSA
jgi:long-chain acyl-CoA synthetase